jgi:DNA invertase Pin-like site-specific DNA recombinase
VVDNPDQGGPVPEYAYARVSTQDQDLTIQLAALEQAGIHPSRIFQEKRSGVAKALPVRDQVLAQLKPSDRLTVWKLDRIGRSVAEILGIVRDLDQRRITFRSLTQPVDTSGYMGRAFLQLLAVFAEMEREMILERTAAGKARRRAEGKHPGGPRMFGFTVTLEPIDHEQALVREAAQRVLQGEPMNQVVDDWQARGLRPIRGERWKVVSLRRLLLNPRTAEIIGQDQHQALVRLFAQPGRQRLGRPAEHMLSGILTCSQCSQPLYGAEKGGKDQPAQLVYRCKRGTGSGGRFAGCGSTVVSMRRADDWAREAFIAAVAGPDFAQALAQRQAEVLSEDVTAAELDEWREEIQDLDQVQGTRFYSDAMKRRHAQLRRLVDAATARLMAAPELEEMMSLPRSEDKLRERWASWTVAQRRTWLRRLLSSIVVRPALVRGRASDVEARMGPRWRM